MISEKEVRHMALIAKSANAVKNVKKYSVVELLIMKEAIDEELKERGY